MYDWILHTIISEQLLPDKVTDSRELNQVGKLLFPNRWLGVFSADTIPNREGYYVVNTDNSKGPGEHWVADINKGRQRYLYDSFGRTARELPWQATYTDPDPEQRKTETNCGARAMAWLVYTQHFGIERGLQI